VDWSTLTGVFISGGRAPLSWDIPLWKSIGSVPAMAVGKQIADAFALQNTRETDLSSWGVVKPAFVLTSPVFGGKGTEYASVPQRL
jgi:hypothetical protein